MKVKIGAYDYRIKPFDPLPVTGYDDLEGLHNGDEQFILIRQKAKPQSQAASLIHELIHAVFRVYNLPGKKMTEEDVCTALDNPLAALLRDNPKLLGVLMDALLRDVPIV